MSRRQRWSDEAPTELLRVGDSEPVDRPRSGPPLWVMKLLIALVTVGVVIASVAVALQMTDRSGANVPTADAGGGDCLTWPPGEPERAMQVDCADQHLFEVISSEATQGSADPADPGHQQTCARAVERALGPRYDPGGRFVVGVVSTSGRLMCGLQLPSNGVASVGFRGRVIEQDQSSVWPAGTCLGIRDGETTDVAVDCGLPHALEITGTADLSTKFGQAAPSTAAQDAVVRDVCGAATSAYLSPVTLDATGLVMRYQPIDAAGWAVGSRRVACRIGSPKAGGGWATLVRSAKDGVLVDGRRPVALLSPPPPPPVPVQLPTTPSEPPPPEALAEVPVRVDTEADESTEVAEDEDAVEAVPHMDGSEGPGPVPHLAGAEAPGPVPHLAATREAPGPVPASPTAAPRP
jgi:hypothetical protein